MASKKSFWQDLWQPDGRKSRGKDGCAYLLVHFLVAGLMSVFILAVKWLIIMPLKYLGIGLRRLVQRLRGRDSEN